MRPFHALGSGLALCLFLGSPARSEEVPSGVVSTYREQNNWVHIYKNPSYDSHAGDHSVLILGLNSRADVVREQSGYVNPSTGRPYDVVIGLAAPGTLAEYERVLWLDHFDARENAGAVGAALSKAFGGKIDAATVDMHSNGNSVGIALLEKNLGFTGVQHLNMMAPDEGFQARNLDPERLSAIVAAHHIKSIDVFVNSGDLVPKAGEVSSEAEDAVLLDNLSSKWIPVLRHYFDYATPVSLGTTSSRPTWSCAPSSPPTLRSSTRWEKAWVRRISGGLPALWSRPVASAGRFCKRIGELTTVRESSLSLIGDAEGNLREIKGYQAGLSLPADQAFIDASAVPAASDERVLARLRGQVALIEKTLSCLTQIAERPAELPNEAYHPPPQPPATPQGP